jgi:methylthioribose-1-phosphate isomerase
MALRTIEWIGGLEGHAKLIDQTLLPGDLAWIECHDVECMWHAIKRLSVRGAPAIGIAAAMGLVLGVRQHTADEPTLFEALDRTRSYLAGARPTAVNLSWALDRVAAVARAHEGAGPDSILEAMLNDARAIRDEDAASSRAIGRNGVELMPDDGGVLTHCNAGGLATAERGTALAVLYEANDIGKRIVVYADETRPLLQGARLTAWELSQAGIDVVTICDGMAAQVMKERRISCVITGADRIAANGDAANKIGTYGVAVLAKAHEIPFYVAAPASTFDMNCPGGEDIPIEQRDEGEIRAWGGHRVVPDEARIYNPAFDVTPAPLIRAIITDRGVIDPVTAAQVARVITG